MDKISQKPDPPTSLGGLINGDQKQSETPTLPPIHSGQQTNSNGPPNKSPFESGRFNKTEENSLDMKTSSTLFAYSILIYLLKFCYLTRYSIYRFTEFL